MAMVISNLAFLVLLAWILVGGAGDLLGLPGSYLAAGAALAVLAVLFGATLVPGPPAVRTTTGAVAGIRNAAPMLAVIAAEFRNVTGVYQAVAALVVIELVFQVPWNAWLGRRRATAPGDPVLTGVL
ncbi:MAG: hypothetical protein ACRDZM_08245 [Acidimicrobiia bacterium]